MSEISTQRDSHEIECGFVLSLEALLITIFAILILIIIASHDIIDHASIVVPLITASALGSTMLKRRLFFLDVLVLGSLILLLHVVNGLQPLGNLVYLLRIAVLGQFLEQFAAEGVDAVGAGAFVEDICSLLAEAFVVILRVEFHLLLNANNIIIVATEEIISHDALLGHLHCDALFVVGHARGVHFFQLRIPFISLLEQLVQVLLLWLAVHVGLVVLASLLKLLLLLLLLHLLLLLLYFGTVDDILLRQLLLFVLGCLLGLLLLVVAV